jgi:hypothetical protein
MVLNAGLPGLMNDVSLSVVGSHSILRANFRDTRPNCY